MSDVEKSNPVDEPDEVEETFDDAAFTEDAIPATDEPLSVDNAAVDPNPTEIQDDGKLDIN